MIVDFDELVLDTCNTMVKVAEFLEMSVEDIFTKATLNGVSLEKEDVSFTGKINEYPYEALSQNEIDTLKYLYNEPIENNSILKRIKFGITAFRCKALNKLNKVEQKWQRIIGFVDKKNGI